MDSFEGYGKSNVTLQELTLQSKTLIRVRLERATKGFGLAISGGTGVHTFYKNEDGIFLSRITDGGPASRAGLKIGDKVVAVNGRSMVSVSHKEAIDILMAGGRVIFMDILRHVLATDDSVKTANLAPSNTAVSSASTMLVKTPTTSGITETNGKTVKASSDGLLVTSSQKAPVKQKQVARSAQRKQPVSNLALQNQTLTSILSRTQNESEQSGVIKVGRPKKVRDVTLKKANATAKAANRKAVKPIESTYQVKQPLMEPPLRLVDPRNNFVQFRRPSTMQSPPPLTPTATQIPPQSFKRFLAQCPKPSPPQPPTDPTPRQLLDLHGIIICKEIVAVDELGPLPEGWDQACTADGYIYFLNHKTKSTTWKDPRLTLNEQSANDQSNSDVISKALGPLPDGWEQAYTSKGEIFYMDHKTKSTTWVDPRLSACFR